MNLECAAEDIANGRSVNWMAARQGDGTIDLAGYGSQGLGELRSHLKGIKEPNVAYARVNDSCIVIRYGGAKARELSKNRTVQKLFKDHTITLDVKDIEKDLSDEQVKSSIQLPGLPGSNAPPLSLPTSNSQSSLMSPEEEAEEEAFRRKYLEEFDRAEKIKQQASERVKAEQTRREAEQRELQEKAQKECQRLEQVKNSLMNSKEGGDSNTLLQQWLTYQAPNSIIWTRRFTQIQNRTLSLYADENTNTQVKLSLNLPGASVREGEEETGMRYSFILKVNDKGYSFYADSQEEFLKARAAVELSTK
ncbi:hypothetical protein HDV05_003774 [Chytridiales sp. JEL 0842]|nr:hypothetical protein HDV05_003774 [Chytridiales sp. JEL 0842]